MKKIFRIFLLVCPLLFIVSCEKEIEAPNLYTPHNGATLNFAPIYFSWEDVEGVECYDLTSWYWAGSSELHIANNLTVCNDNYTHVGSTAFWGLSDHYEPTYYWKVKAGDKWSETRSFTIP